jgi:hypothetical protein
MLLISLILGSNAGKGWHQQIFHGLISQKPVFGYNAIDSQSTRSEAQTILLIVLTKTSQAIPLIFTFDLNNRLFENHIFFLTLIGQRQP